MNNQQMQIDWSPSQSTVGGAKSGEPLANRNYGKELTPLFRDLVASHAVPPRRMLLPSSISLRSPARYHDQRQSQLQKNPSSSS